MEKQHKQLPAYADVELSISIEELLSDENKSNSKIRRNVVNFLYSSDGNKKSMDRSARKAGKDDTYKNRSIVLGVRVFKHT